jgi:CPA2 family monovalent cation:H+ antiporter-2
MIGAMTIITTFISPYMIKLGWKVPHKVFSKKEEKDKEGEGEGNGEEENK